MEGQTGAPLLHFITDSSDVCKFVYLNVLMLDFTSRFLVYFHFHYLVLLTFPLVAIFRFKNQFVGDVKEKVLLWKHIAVESFSIRIIGNLIFWWEKIRRKWEMLFSYIINHSFCLAHMNVIDDEIANIYKNSLNKIFLYTYLKLIISHYWECLDLWVYSISLSLCL